MGLVCAPGVRVLELVAPGSCLRGSLHGKGTNARRSALSSFGAQPAAAHAAGLDNPTSAGSMSGGGAARAVAARLETRAFAALSDDELVAGIRQASEAHFNELYERYFSRVYGFVFSRIHNHADTEEVVQETFTAVFRSLDNYRAQASLLSWIFGIAKNTANNALRKSRNEGERLEAIAPEALQPAPSLLTADPEAQLHLRRFTDSIAHRLESVSTWQTEVFLMRHVEDLSIGEICARTSRSSDAVRSSLYRVKRFLLDGAEARMAVTGS